MPVISPRCDGAILSKLRASWRPHAFPPPRSTCKWAGWTIGLARRACETAMPSPPSPLCVLSMPPNTGKWTICGGVAMRCVGRGRTNGMAAKWDRRRDSPTTGLTVRSGWLLVSLSWSLSWSLPPCVYLSPCLFLPLTQAAGNPSPASFVPPANRFVVAFPCPGAVPGSACTCTVRYLRDRALQPATCKRLQATT